ncbi:hypothetical protein HBH56_043700 [Parastagonospora nodorum]|uniref:Uncharacterized protein n=1 Tax=Phaeosphaeria nodorum (strain SN15 / ATCC MYA-4574 / FGSC 10173) TaxID=321614 RepID=A0A7U2EXL5_PHANO|nr:hypothetical protein HBH56_043700 [Parastagonospora nodorum]QRC92824.1 hypothetical protein JI435_428600 [Parastagonospora nodorum SN15]KAH3932932.1 hypothetical protein HBH54_071450 [Parastagonospora nodorum]KAH3946365.1 hypothetical protein HBH53_130640 [Parastagonospora nodorum]KAH4038542.1 hypothetical protein HBI09_052660 [Parastagonospora nodorum]
MPPSPKLNEGRTFRRRYVGAFLILLASILIGLIASTDGSAPSVEAYYSSLESRIGYWLVLGNARHCGLYAKGQLSPFPISKAQRAMEDKL